MFSYTGKTRCTLNWRRTGGTGISVYFCRWLLGRSRCKRRNHRISGRRIAYSERQPQRELYAQHPLHQRSGRADHGVQRKYHRDAAGTGTRAPASGAASDRAKVYENHGIDGRYTGPHDVAPTMSARYGTGGNNIPLVQQEEVICIAGNAIDRQPQNGGNGFGWQRDISYTLTATDRHSVYARQRVDQFRDDEIASTESARQHKDATDLICQPPSAWDADCRNLIRRLTPLECERLQGYPDGWTDVPGASDSARYKALGNSVAIPCVEYLMQRVAMVITLDLEWDF